MIGIKTLTILLLTLLQNVKVATFSVIKQNFQIKHWKATNQVVLSMGLYDDIDEPLPDLPPDLTKNRRTRDDIRSQRRKNIDLDNYLPEEKDESGGILPGFDTEINWEDDEEDLQKPNLFEFDPIGSERNGRLPDLKRTLYDGIPCYFEASDKKTQIVMEKTECSSHDACWALEAHEGDIVKSVISISMAQRGVLNDSVALPDKEEVETTDWDEELRTLNKSEKGNGKELGEEFENAGRSIGMDGLQERKESMKRREMNDNIRRIFDKGEEDQDWLPGKQNPKPVDDEPWFTG